MNSIFGMCACAYDDLKLYSIKDNNNKKCKISEWKNQMETVQQEKQE